MLQIAVTCVSFAASHRAAIADLNTAATTTSVSATVSPLLLTISAASVTIAADNQ